MYMVQSTQSPGTIPLGFTATAGANQLYNYAIVPGVTRVQNYQTTKDVTGIHSSFILMPDAIVSSNYSTTLNSWFNNNEQYIIPYTSNVLQYNQSAGLIRAVAFFMRVRQDAPDWQENSDLLALEAPGLGVPVTPTQPDPVGPAVVLPAPP